MMKQTWLVLLCKKPGDVSEPPPGIDVFNRFNGPGGFREYWREVTQGVLDLSFVVTQEWLKVEYDLAAYPGDDNSERGPFVEACKKAAKNYPLDKADGIVVYTHVDVDLHGKPGIVVCSEDHPHYDIAHEVGHGVGLAHSFGAPSLPQLPREQSLPGHSPYSFPPDQFYAVEYGACADIMSVKFVWDQNQEGPGLCGFNLRDLTTRLGDPRPAHIRTLALDERKVVARIAPLTDPSDKYPNLLIARMNHGGELYEYSVELRTKENWDAGLPKAGVLVHERRPDGTVVWLYRDSTADPDLPPGALFSRRVDYHPLVAGDELVDPVRRLRVNVLELDLNQGYATVEVEVGADPFPLPQRFRAVSSWAKENGFAAAFPNFHQAPYGPSWKFKALLLDPNTVEWRDIPAAELGHPVDFTARFRAMNDWARRNGYRGAFPNFHEADHGQGTVYGALLMKDDFADWQDLPAVVVGYLETPEARFKAVNNWADSKHFLGAFPNFYEAEYDTILIKKGAAEWRDIPVTELGNPQTPEARFRAVNDWAHTNGYLGGFPNFHQADHGQGTVYGTILIKKVAADWKDILAGDLGNPQTFEARFQAVNDWAQKSGYRGGFPNFHQADHGKGVVYGTILLKNEAADWRDHFPKQSDDPIDIAGSFREVNDWAHQHGYQGAYPNFHQGESGKVYGTILIHTTAGVIQTFRADELGHPADNEARFRALDAAAKDRGFRAGFPIFEDAYEGRGTVFGSILLRENAVEWQDIPAAELGNPQTPEARFRAMNGWAHQHEYRGAFPSFHQADRGQGTVYGAFLIKKEAADWQDIAAAALGNPQTPEARIRAANDWAHKHGYVGAFPNFYEADYGPVLGTILVKKEAADWRDIPAAELGHPQTPDARFRAVNDWAHQHGYRSGYPNFHQAKHGQGTVYGTILLKKAAADWRDISAAELGNPQTAEARFRAVNDWAKKHGYRGAYPNFHKADHGNGVVYGTILLKNEAADWRDLYWKKLGSPADFTARFRTVNDWADQHGYRGAFPNFYQADYGKVYGTILIKSGFGEHRDLPLSQLVFR